jgi:hypothetical protein
MRANRSSGKLTIHSAILPEMSKHAKDDWLRDIDARQRNVVFPDTVQNEGRFWRNIWAGKSLSLAQRVGVLVLLLFFGGSVLFYLRMLWPEGQGSWWQKVISGYGVYIVVVGAIVAFVVIGNRRARRNAPRH